jgi:hypothetical protein
MAQLEHWEDAIVPIAKFAQYSLDAGSQSNRGKWRAFAEVGYATHSEAGRRAGAEDLIRQLRAALGHADATPWKGTKPGDPRYDVRVEVQGPNGRRGTLHTGWQCHRGQPPRLITNWLEVHREVSP